MAIFGWIVLSIFALIGFGVAGFLAFEFLMTQLRTFKAKVDKNTEVNKEDIKARGELKKARLAKKRAAQDRCANRKLDAQIANMQDKSNEKFGGKKEKHNEE